jgi:hypothetical protein
LIINYANKKRLLPLTLTALLALAVLAGCGGSGDDSTNSAAGDGAAAEQADNGEPKPEAGEGGKQSSAGSAGGEKKQGGPADGSEGSKSEFIKRADAICAEARAQIGKEVEPYFSQNLKQTAPTIVEQIIAPGVSSEISDIRSLEASSEDAEAQVALIDALQEMIEAAEANPQAFIFNVEAAKKPEAIAKEYGFASCGGLV